MKNLKIRTYQDNDEIKVIKLWQMCHLTTPWNNPKKDIERKLSENPNLFFVGELNSDIVTTVMSGYDGHRGWIYYLAVTPGLQKKSIATQMIHHAESVLKELGCPKINLMVRNTNLEVISFYKKVGYMNDPVVVLSKRLSDD